LIVARRPLGASAFACLQPRLRAERVGGRDFALLAHDPLGLRLAACTVLRERAIRTGSSGSIAQSQLVARDLVHRQQ
jgi:hypothetical protein